MKKTLTINLNGIVFHIDDDAYQVLQKYLSDIGEHLGDGDDAREIVADVEARIAELLSNMLEMQKKEVVSMEMVQSIMNTMGSPVDFCDDEDNAEPKSNNKQKRRKNRRLYRDPERAMLSGVAAGIAAYFGWDPIAIRILLIVFTIAGLGSFVIPAYIIMWILMPQAVTAAQRLEMQGEDVTVESIKNEFNNAKSYVESDKFKSQAQSVGQRLGQAFIRIFKFCLTLLGALLGFIAFVLFGVLCIALIAIVFGLGTWTALFPFELFNSLGWPIWVISLSIILLILVVGLPLFTLIYGVIKYVRTKRWFSPAYNWITLIIWMAAIIGLLSMGLKGMIDNDFPQWNTTWFTQNDDAELQATEIRTLDTFHSIDVTGAMKIEYTQDQNQMLQIQSTQNYINNIQTEVRDSVLYITANMNKYTPVTVALSSPEIRNIEVAGASSFESKNTIEQRNMTINMAGAGNVDLDLHIDSLLKIETQGVSNVELQGQAYHADIKVAGASKVDAENLKTQMAKVNGAGGSKIKIWCEQDLKVQAYGASKVVYRGNPTISERIAVGASSIKQD